MVFRRSPYPFGPTFATFSVVKRVSLNIDLGELPDEPDELYSLATIVNIACGGHAGSRSTMAHALDLANQSGAKIAAHPGYPDRENFGRKTMPLTMFKLAWSLRAQINGLVHLAEPRKTTIFAVKPHGALYHDARKYGLIAEILLTTVEYISEFYPTLQAVIIGPPDGLLKQLTLERKWPYLEEGFADRTYLPNGELVSRSEPNALITDPEQAAAQAVRLAQSGTFDTLCVHGDNPKAIEIARAVRKALQDAELLEGV
jgi:5-oxoprolinase (ATP-hydrolysing) subunit A